MDRRLFTSLPPVIVKAAVAEGEARLLLEENTYRNQLEKERELF
jgi:hypothetical protein